MNRHRDSKRPYLSNDLRTSLADPPMAQLHRCETRLQQRSSPIIKRPDLPASRTSKNSDISLSGLVNFYQLAHESANRGGRGGAESRTLPPKACQSWLAHPNKTKKTDCGPLLKELDREQDDFSAALQMIKTAADSVISTIVSPARPSGSVPAVIQGPGIGQKSKKGRFGSFRGHI